MSNSLIPLQSIVVYRSGAFKTPEIGKPFSFEDNELEGLEEGVHYRKPVVEAPVSDATEVDPKTATKPAGKGGKKGSDESL